MDFGAEPPRWLSWSELVLGCASLTWGLLVASEKLLVTSLPDTPPFVFTLLVMSSLPGGIALIVIGGIALLRTRC